MIAAGAVLQKGTAVPEGQLWGGNPAAYMRQLTAAETAYLTKSSQSYADLSAVHAQEDAAAQAELGSL
jgi:gamma-carbonic anhydrase